MRFSFAIATGLLAACSTAFAAPQPKGEGFIGKTVIPANHSNDTKEYIITFMRNETIPKGVEEYLEMMQLKGQDVVKFQSTNNYTKVWVFEMCDDHAKAFQNLTEVAYVEEKAMIESFATQKSGAPWGLQRISNEAGASGSPQGQDFTYSFTNETLGAGVDIYVIDTGVRTSHAVFTGRATEGFTATGSFVDGDGHGTHVAGTAGGAKFGVAQGANIIEVKVLGDDGSGSSTDTIAGMDWVISNHEKRKTQPGFVGSIMSMSWGLKGTANSVDEVIAGASQAGIHISVAAGNDGADACGSTPAHLGGANSDVVTVGSVNINNQVSTFSNIGKCVDIYAPGEQILSAWSTGDTIINFLSGTSMACPHTTGVMAVLLSQDVAGLGQNPAALKAKLLKTAREGKITGRTGGSANLLLSNGVDGGVAKRLVKNYVVPDHSGSPAARAAAAMANDITIDGRFQLHSRDAQLRF
ncbi:subtilisin-like protein [Cucurbitaria berberidis CBS 394.84]|uniref:Subtilisin-like protein n=1 Tax=Cucurbitaria berberidis CBS 394.84 TaxID=1168544 RepID=A0A9P4L5H6_9PLEO|nr:subtilisin-like protein [Cucurbitaria berberidis CBS 394.84]KAF1842660.1 subtilisin-like protein [Cucurbitaria berberidis CBS 394.84]